MSAERPSAVVWDVGNVIVRWDPRTLYSKIFPDAAERDWFLSHVCTMAWHAETDRGLSFSENVARLSAEHPEHAPAIAAWRDRWWEMFSGPIDETVAAIEDLHARDVPMFGLTNMPAETAQQVFAMSPAFGRLSDIVVSGVEGLIKPEPEIYHLTARRAGRAPGELLFVDDNLANIEAARALGFHVHLFDDPAALRPTLERCGLL